MSKWSDREILYHYYENKLSTGSLLRKFMNAVKECLFFVFGYSNSEHKILFFLSLRKERPDYDRFMNKIYESCPMDKGYINFTRKKGLDGRFLWHFITGLGALNSLKSIRNPDTQGESFRCSAVERIIIYMHLAKILSIRDRLKKLSLVHTSGIVVLGDAWVQEHELVRYANESNIVTVTAQHGLFIPNIKNISYDILNFWNVPSSYALNWGDSSKKLYEKYSPSTKCVVCGNPTLKRTAAENENSEVIGIVFDIPRFHEENQKMLLMAEEYAEKNNKRIKLRFHPTDNSSAYIFNSEISSVDKSIDDAYVIIGHTSSMFFSLLSQGKKVLRYVSKVPFYQLSDSVCFENGAQLSERLNHLDDINFQDVFAQHIKYIDDEAFEKYKEFFNNCFCEQEV